MAGLRWANDFVAPGVEPTIASKRAAATARTRRFMVHPPPRRDGQIRDPWFQSGSSPFPHPPTSIPFVRSARAKRDERVVCGTIATHQPAFVSSPERRASVVEDFLGDA